MAEITLRHYMFEWTQTIHFYDGRAEAVDGVVTMSTQPRHWVQTVHRDGYDVVVATGKRLNWGEMNQYCNELEAAEKAGAEPIETPAPETTPSETDAPVEEPTHEHSPVVDVSDPDAVKVTCAECGDDLAIDPESVEQSTESAEEKSDDEGPDGRGLTPDDDGVRTGPDEGAAGIPEEGMDGSGSDRAPVRGKANRS